MSVLRYVVVFLIAISLLGVAIAQDEPLAEYDADVDECVQCCTAVCADPTTEAECLQCSENCNQNGCESGEMQQASQDDSADEEEDTCLSCCERACLYPTLPDDEAECDACLAECRDNGCKDDCALCCRRDCLLSDRLCTSCINNCNSNGCPATKGDTASKEEEEPEARDEECDACCGYVCMDSFSEDCATCLESCQIKGCSYNCDNCCSDECVEEGSERCSACLTSCQYTKACTDLQQQNAANADAVADVPAEQTDNGLLPSDNADVEDDNIEWNADNNGDAAPAAPEVPDTSAGTDATAAEDTAADEAAAAEPPSEPASDAACTECCATQCDFSTAEDCQLCKATCLIEGCMADPCVDCCKTICEYVKDDPKVCSMCFTDCKTNGCEL